MTKRFLFSELPTADLIVDAVYEGGTSGHAGDDPLQHLLSCGNMGGFRFRGSPRRGGYQLVVLYTTLGDPDWPDHLDTSASRFTYYGDNKSPGRGLLDTPRGGNVLLKYCFEQIHGSTPHRDRVPPFFIFSKEGAGRSVAFRGLAAPGAPNLPHDQNLVTVFGGNGTEQYQNYRAVFTILDVPVVQRGWIRSLIVGETGSPPPVQWRDWVDRGRYTVSCEQE